MKNGIWISWLCLLGVFAPCGFAADSERLAPDPRITIKKLPNGLTYYIRQNQKPENRASFRLVVNAGSILETEEEQGLAHFLEHMAFNGTRNFEKLELVNFLERIGMQFGADLNAYTSFDETVYMLEIPMDDEEILKKSLQILEDWAHQITFDAEEIEKERGVVIEEWRTRRGAQGRLQDKQIPVLLHDSIYAQRLPIGTTNVIATVSRETFVNFYRKWYRPDLMAVVAVGDFDAEKIERLIVEHFGKLRNPEEAPPRPAPAVPDHEETLFSIETDPELTYTMLQITCKHPPAPEGTVADYRRALVENLYSTMLNRRLQERVQEANPPYLYAGVTKSSMVRTKYMAAQMAVVKEGEFAEGLKALLLESRRARRDGFTATEFERAKADLVRALEKAYEEREKTESSAYAEEYIRNFLQGEPIPGIEKELELTRQFFTGITLEEVNRAADRWITEKNRVILYSAPQKPGLAPPTRGQILQVITEADQAPIIAYDDGVSEAPLLPQKPNPGRVVSETKLDSLGAAEWTLSNDIRVLLKPTEFKNDQILMQAFSPGGHSLVENSEYLSALMAPMVISQSGLGDYDLIQLEKKLAGKVVSVNAAIGDQSEQLSGSASPKDLETWFQLMHLYFTRPRADEKTFQSLMARMRVSLQNRDRNPMIVFGDAVEKALYENHHRHRPLTVALLDEIDRETAFRVYRDRFADASDFTFVFVGAFTPEALRPLVETYLASLPDRDRVERGRHAGDDPRPGLLQVDVRKGIEAKSSVRLLFHGEAAWSNEARYALRGAVDVLSIRLREVLREDQGGVYGVNVFGNLNRRPKETFVCGISFTCSPDNVDKLIEASLQEVERLKAEGPSEENLAKVRESHLRSYEEGLKENGFWLANLSFYRENELELDGILTFPERAKALTAEKVQEAARLYFSTQNLLKARLFPESPGETAPKQ